jgi:hypothetical protein
MSKSVQIYNAPRKLNCDHLLGTFLGDEHYSMVVDDDVDFYAPTNPLHPKNDESTILFKFRKNVFPAELQNCAYEGLIQAAGPSQNRGLAAGPRNEKLQNRDWVTAFQLAVLEAFLDTETRLDDSDPIDQVILNQAANKYNGTPSRGLVWLRNQIIASGETYEGFFDNWFARTKPLSPVERCAESRRLQDNFISDTTYANPVLSGIAGFFDRYPRIPYGRATSYTEANPDLFAKSFPYLAALTTCFKHLLPQRFAKQQAACDQLDPHFVIPGSVFTTLTINKTFRTAAHRDAGDLGRGFSNLGVIQPPGSRDFKGGMLVLPEYEVAINIRPGDLLLIANHDAIHGNTAIEPVRADCCPECIERMSIVAYFRESMLELGSWEYEQYRRQYVEHRKALGKKHPDSNGPLWNGISKGMWDGPEWREFLSSKDGGPEMLEKYHPLSAEGNLESFFT